MVVSRHPWVAPVAGGVDVQAMSLFFWGQRQGVVRTLDVLPALSAGMSAFRALLGENRLYACDGGTSEETLSWRRSVLVMKHLSHRSVSKLPLFFDLS